MTLAAVWPPRRSLSKTQQPLLTPSSPERELGCGHTSSSGCGCYSHSPRNLVRPWGVGGSPHLQKAGHGADVVGACSLPHIVHPLACLQHNTSSVTHQPPQSHCSPWGPSRGKTATLKQRIKRAPHLHWVGAGNFLVLPRGPVLSEPSPGPLLPEDHYSEGDRGKGVLQLHSILSECFWAGGVVEGGILRWQGPTVLRATRTSPTLLFIHHLRAALKASPPLFQSQKAKEERRKGSSSGSRLDGNSEPPSSTYPVDEDKLGQAGVGVLHPAEGVHHLPAVELLHHLLQAPLCSRHREGQQARQLLPALAQCPPGKETQPASEPGFSVPPAPESDSWSCPY